MSKKRQQQEQEEDQQQEQQNFFKKIVITLDKTNLSKEIDIVYRNKSSIIASQPSTKLIGFSIRKSLVTSFVQQRRNICVTADEVKIAASWG